MLDMFLPIIKQQIGKVPDAFDDISKIVGCKVKLLVENHYQLEDTVLSYEQYIKLPEESQKKVVKQTLLILLTKNKAGNYAPHKTISLMEIINNIGKEGFSLDKILGDL